ncbi:hypothetical protein F0562_018633 [Nyssa sinensis]|uniref:F-box domain-containing protein n=1 Tax=Nyssa sinensis TaxID=561372 RepID=A0A5J4ZDI5_9ASTE|nr:hypothetical protein F0562_018633 [Nyssa sinensis]
MSRHRSMPPSTAATTTTTGGGGATMDCASPKESPRPVNSPDGQRHVHFGAVVVMDDEESRGRNTNNQHDGVGESSIASSTDSELPLTLSNVKSEQSKPREWIKGKQLHQPCPSTALAEATDPSTSSITATETAIAMNTTSKLCKKNNSDQENQLTADSKYESAELLPGLPDHLAQLCLSTLHPSVLYQVCRSWRRLIYSPSFPPFFSLYALLSPTSTTKSHNKEQSDSVEFFTFDPIAFSWRPLPSPPSDPPLHLLHRHPSFISRNLPIQSLTVSGHLVLIAATTHNFLPALSRPLVFDPVSNQWLFGPPLSTPRRWCAAGSLGGAVFVASGVGRQYQGDVARSVEKWDMKKSNMEWKWEKMAALKDGKFSREAVEAVEYRGKLCMVNVKGNAVKEGAVYDAATNRWEEMPTRMLTGWNGPAAAVTEDGDAMYVVDEAKGSLRKYDPDKNCWKELIESSEHLKGAKQIVAGRGKVCVVCADGGRIAVLDVVATPAKLWFVNPPPEMEVVAVHILPRIIRPAD